MKNALLIALLILCTVASADTIQTKSGETLKGRVIEETQDHVRLRTRYGVLTVPAKDVRRHSRTTYVVTLKDGSTLEGRIVGETKTTLSLKVGGKTTTVATANLQGVSEKPPRLHAKEPPKLDRRGLVEAHRRTLAHFNKKEYAQALAECKRILATDPDNYIAHYNAACAHSQMKQSAKAIEALVKSIEAGYVNFQHMEADTDLDNIRKEAGYLAILKNKEAYIRKSTEKAVARLAKSMKQRGVDASKYKVVRDEERNFIYLHTKTDEQLAAVRRDLDAYADHQWAHLFQNRPQQPLYIVLLTPGDSRKIFRGRVGGVFQGAINTLFCGDIPTFKMMNSSVVVHEFTHALHFADMLARKQRHPVWLMEGLATLFEASDRNGTVTPRQSHRLMIVQAAVKAKRILPWKMLVKLDHAKFMRVARIAYAQSRYMLFYMYKKGLLKRFYDEYTNQESYASDQSALEAFEVVFGKPIESVEREWEQWVLKQRVPPIPFLGVQTRAKDEQVVVQKVMGRSPAAKAGMKPGDVIASIDGDEIKASTDVIGAIGSRSAGDEVEVVVVRDGKEHPITVKLGKRRLRLRGLPKLKVAPYLGLAVEEKDGAVHTKAVAKDSPAAKAGLKPGDAVLEFNGKKLATVRDYLAALRKVRPGQKAKVKMKRDGKDTVVTVTVGKQP